MTVVASCDVRHGIGNRRGIIDRQDIEAGIGAVGSDGDNGVTVGGSRTEFGHQLIAGFGNQAVGLAHGFAVFSLLANVAEDRAGKRRAQSQSKAGAAMLKAKVHAGASRPMEPIHA